MLNYLVTTKLLNPTKVKVYVDYGQKWMAKRQHIMNPDKEGDSIQQWDARIKFHG